MVNRHENGAWGIAAEMSVADAFEDIAMSCVTQFREHASGIGARNDPEDVHQSRVAIRRLRAAFSLFAPALPKARTQRLRADLGQLADTLGAVRDLDVVLARIDDPALRSRLSAMKDAALLHLVRTLDHRQTDRILRRLDRFSRGDDWRTNKRSKASGSVSAFSEKVLERRFRKLRKRGRRLAEMTDEERHRFRIAVKKLRYGAEFFGFLCDHPKRLGRFLKRIERLQEHLGILSDALTAQRILLPLGVPLDDIRHPKRERKELARSEKAFSRLAEIKPFWN